MSQHRHRFTVTFEEGPSRDVTARSHKTARETATSAQRLVGYKKAYCRAIASKDQGHVGTSDKTTCPMCQAGLFPETRS